MWIVTFPFAPVLYLVTGGGQRNHDAFEVDSALIVFFRLMPAYIALCMRVESVFA